VKKGVGVFAGESPVREIVIAPGSSRDSRAGNQTVEALDGRAVEQLREHAGRNVSERRAGSKIFIAEADQRRNGEGRRRRVARAAQALNDVGRWFRRGSGDGMYVRTPASTREVPTMGAMRFPNGGREGRSRVAGWREVRSTAEAGNDRGGRTSLKGSEGNDKGPRRLAMA